MSATSQQNIETVRNSASIYTTPTLQESYFTHQTRLSPESFHHLQTHTVVQDINQGWNSENFLTPRIPVVIDTVSDKPQFDLLGVPRCIHLPIKMAHSDIRVPNNYLQFRETLEKIFDAEMAINSAYEKYYAYLTVDQLHIRAGQSQRVSGLHVDGLPRDRTHPEKHPIDHAYLVANTLPSRFFAHPFDMRPYDLQTHHFYNIFERLGDIKKSFQAQPYEINLMNAYSVHDSPVADRDYMRTIVRVEFSVLQFDRVGNSHNPCFEYRWDMIPRPIPERLYDPDYQILQAKGCSDTGGRFDGGRRLGPRGFFRSAPFKTSSP
ncbi:hypothetical protein SBOR_8508 [Sclerotinia borealis F-4128]|uniref:Uncharacterized protein n=1 Tax=Sclerotinia borealis (strain F-4128) TaxID=1432307 RepID=W9C5V4_SCLBF|nr:hypothetical protein SBOR_8508 [Sclerotinia borealis F-4128]